MTGLDQTIIVDNTNAMETVLEAKKAIEENNSKEAHRLLEKAMSNVKRDRDVYIEAAECYKMLEDFDKM